MHLYRQSIALFGIVIPIAIAAIVVGSSFLLKAKMTDSFANKQAKYGAYEVARLAEHEIETQVVRQRAQTDRWNVLLAQETASAVTINLKEISESLPAKEIQKTASERLPSKGGFGVVSAQASSQIRIAFRGTFRTMQRAFLELETRMPQLQLQELRIDPSSTQSSLLNFQVTYTAWEN